MRNTRRGGKQSSASSPYVYWEGEDPSDGSSFDFIQDDEGNMAGSIVDVTTKNVMQFHNENGTSIVTITATRDFPLEGHPVSIPDEERNLRSRQQTVPIPSAPQQVENHQESRTLVYDDSGSNLDVMVVWTKKAECKRSGLQENCTPTGQTEATMRTLINLAVEETNAAYQASGVDTEIYLAHAYRHPTHVEQSFEDSLTGLRLGTVPGVSKNREKYGADIVALLIDDDEYCGMAYTGPRIDRMFSVTSWNCATGYYSFGHEIGHNLGLQHDRGTLGTCGQGGYQFGYRDPKGSFRTILAYNCRTDQCDEIESSYCVRIKRFSNTKYNYNGKPLGTENENNARVINDVRREVASYFPHVGSITNPTPAPIAPPVESPNAAPVASPVTNIETCKDGTDKFDVEGEMKGCEWVKRKNTEKRCQQSIVSINCPATCNKCNSNPNECKDVEERFMDNGQMRSCWWVGNKDTDRRCSKSLTCRQKCPKTCDECSTVTTSTPIASPVASPVASPASTPTPCEDVEGKFEYNNKRRSCDWVKNNTAKRCKQYILATNCPATCKSKCP